MSIDNAPARLSGAAICGTLVSWRITQPRKTTIYEQTVTAPEYPLHGIVLRVRSEYPDQTVIIAGLAMEVISLAVMNDRNLLTEQKAAWTAFSRHYGGYLTDALGNAELCAVEFGGVPLNPEGTYREFCRALKGSQPPRGWRDIEIAEGAGAFTAVRAITEAGSDLGAADATRPAAASDQQTSRL